MPPARECAGARLSLPAAFLYLAERSGGTARRSIPGIHAGGPLPCASKESIPPSARGLFLPRTSVYADHPRLRWVRRTRPWKTRNAVQRRPRSLAFRPGWDRQSQLETSIPWGASGKARGRAMTRQTMFSIAIAISAIPKSAADRHGTRTQLAKLRGRCSP
jgi:hypothetical protein